MRQIGNIHNESQARLFSNYLYAKGINNEVETEAPGKWVLWVHDEDHLNQATEMWERFLKNPTAVEYRDEARKASRMREAEEKSQKDYARRIRDGSQVFPRISPYGVGFVTLILIALCGYVAVKTNLGREEVITRHFWIASPEKSPAFYGYLFEVRHGEFWRLLSPILLHGSPAHLICNLLWLFQLGSLLEDRRGSAFFICHVVIVGMMSNLAQYFLHGPRFGGMSGVVYGLFGYLWIRGKFDPASGMAQDQQTVLLALIWFVVCFTGWVGPIANTAHATGLIIGMAWGYLAAKWPRR
jgi:GlpG protein